MDGSGTLDRAGRRGPVEGEHVIGCDGDRAARPGVPMRAAPSSFAGPPAPGPAEQEGIDRRTHRAGIHRPTPVFGTTQPLHGLSGMIRRTAYGIPEHRARHWMLLMAADRVDVLEDRLTRPGPIPYLAGAAVGAALASAWRRRSV